MKNNHVLTDKAENLSKTPEAILEEVDGYIRALVRTCRPRLLHQEAADLEIDEIIQNVRIKFWIALQKGPISNYKAYIRRIVHNEIVSFMRCRTLHPLSFDDEGEVRQGVILITVSESTQDPAEQLERLEAVREYALIIANAVVNLPPVQQRAVLLVMKEYSSDVFPVVEILRRRGLDPASVLQAKEKRESQILRSSLFTVRKKLQRLLYEMAPGKIGVSRSS